MATSRGQGSSQPKPRHRGDLAPSSTVKTLQAVWIRAIMSIIDPELDQWSVLTPRSFPSS